jgi:spore germination protein GerM
VATEHDARSRADVPFGLLDEHAEPVLPNAANAPAGALTACFVDAALDGIVAIVVPVDGEPSAATALDALDDLPSDNVDGLTTSFPTEPTIAGVDVSGGVAEVDLAEGFDEIVPSANQLTYVAQVVCTLTALPGLGQVTFSVDGAPVAVPVAGGQLVSSPVSRDDYTELLAAGDGG